MNHSNFLSALTNILGERYVLSDKTQTASYLIEQRGLFESACLAVVKPASTEEVRACVKLCDEHDISIVPMGGNTGLCGGAVATEQQIILSLERLNKILDIDTENYSMTVQAGCILANIQNVASEQDRLFPLSLGAEGSCQIGGNLSTNAGGINVLHYGNARDLCLGIEAVLPNGTVFSDLSSLRKDNTGYGFKQLLIGAEGSLGIITAATLKLFPQPKEAVTALVALEKIESVISLYNLIREASSDRITTFELIPSIAIEFTAKHFSEHPNPFDTAHAWHVLVVVHSANPADNLSELFSGALETAFERELINDALIAQNLSQADHFLALREKLVAAQKLEGASIKHDISVPISAIPEFIARAKSALHAIAPNARPYPFGHVGDGNIHYNISQPAGTDGTVFMDQREAIHDAVLEIVHDLNGSFSAEHGIGRLKTDMIPRYKGKTVTQTLITLKRAIDPKNIMNPGVVVDAD